MADDVIRADAHRDEFHRDQQWHKPVRVAATGNVTIATGLNNGDTIDGVTLATGDRVLLPAQSTPSQNGIYTVRASPGRSYDMLTGQQVRGAIVYVISGTANGGKVFKNTNTSVPTVGSTSLTFVDFTIPDGTDPGDLLVWDGSAWDILGVGSDGEVLTADSGEALGLDWSTASAGLTVEDEGSDTGADATTLDFVGAGVVATGATGDKTITISGAPTGSAGGDLSGTYPNPSVVDDSHSHTSATAPGGGVGPILISDSHSTPIVFADILLTEDEGDILYADLP